MENSSEIWDKFIYSKLSEHRVNQQGKQSTESIPENPMFSELDSIESFKEKFLKIVDESVNFSTVKVRVELFLKEVLGDFIRESQYIDNRDSCNVPTISGCSVNNTKVKINVSSIKRLVDSILKGLEDEVQKEFEIGKSDINQLVDKM